MRDRLLTLAVRLRATLYRTLRIDTRGVRVVATNPAGDVLLVRHRYGRSDLWMLPGGGVGRREDFAVAAARELVEETACRADTIAFFAEYVSTAEGRRDTLHVYVATTRDRPVPQPSEIAEARFFALDALPAKATRATRQRIAEVFDAGAPDERW